MTAAVTPFDSARRLAVAPEPHTPNLLVPVEYELHDELHIVGNQFKRGRVFYFQDNLDEWLRAGKVTSTAQVDVSYT